MLICTENPEDVSAIRRLVSIAFQRHPHHESGAEPTGHDIVDRLRERGELTLLLVTESQGATDNDKQHNDEAVNLHSLITILAEQEPNIGFSEEVSAIALLYRVINLGNSVSM